MKMDGSDNKNKSNFAKQTGSASGSKKIAFSRTDKVRDNFFEHIWTSSILMFIIQCFSTFGS